MGRTWSYRKGLHELDGGCYAYLQPPGGWGWSNAGLVADGSSSLLIDTLFDLRLTREMLSEMRFAVPAATIIDRVVNTHANGDHCFGNQLLAGAEIIASRRAAEEMGQLPPAKVALLMRTTRWLQRLGTPASKLTSLLGALGLKQLRAMGQAADFVQEIFGDFQLEEPELEFPTRTFDDQLDLRVGDVEVHLIEVGPAHSSGDVMVSVPRARTVYTGDILFVGMHPIILEGPLSRWIAACDRLLQLDAEIFVPGHGPITDAEGVLQVKRYLEQLEAETRRCYEAGMSAVKAARSIDLRAFAHWSEAERVVINVEAVYRELSGQTAGVDGVERFAHMATYRGLL